MLEESVWSIRIIVRLVTLPATTHVQEKRVIVAARCKKHSYVFYLIK